MRGQMCGQSCCNSDSCAWEEHQKEHADILNPAAAVQKLPRRSEDTAGDVQTSPKGAKSVDFFSYEGVLQIPNARKLIIVIILAPRKLQGAVW